MMEVKKKIKGNGLVDFFPQNKNLQIFGRDQYLFSFTWRIIFLSIENVTKSKARERAKIREIWIIRGEAILGHAKVFGLKRDIVFPAFDDSIVLREKPRRRTTTAATSNYP